MAKVGFVADVHVGNHRKFGGPVVGSINRRCRQVIDTLQLAVKKAEAEGCEGFVVCGDLVDSTNVSPQVVTELQRVLTTDMAVIVLRGNHDMVSTTPGDHALGPLNPLLTVQEKPDALWVGDHTVIVAVPFQPGPAKGWFTKAVAEALTDLKVPSSPKVTKLLAFHLGVVDGQTPKFLRDAHDAVPLELVQDVVKKHGFAAAFCGNWHDRRNWGNIYQIGTLAPTGFDNPGMEGVGSLAIWDSESGKAVTYIVPGARFLKLTSQENAPVEWARALSEMGVPLGDAQPWKRPANTHSLYVQMVAPAERIAHETDWLRTQRERGIVCDGEVIVDAKEVREAARSAATTARSAETLDSALAGFVKEMPLAEGVDRAEVLAVTKQYLGGA